MSPGISWYWGSTRPGFSSASRGIWAAAQHATAIRGFRLWSPWLTCKRLGGRDILRLVVGNGARLIDGGIAIGLAAAFALQRLVSSLLYASRPRTVLAAVALAACYLPALRATRVDPLPAMRYEQKFDRTKI